MSKKTFDKIADGLKEAIAFARSAHDPAAIAAAISFLRAAGYTVIAPATDAIPEPEVGQVWVSPKATVPPRTVVEVFGLFVVHQHYSAAIPKARWRAWARRTGARPQ